MDARSGVAGEREKPWVLEYQRASRRDFGPDSDVARNGIQFGFSGAKEVRKLESLPDWAKKSIAQTADDDRPVVYKLDQLETAETHDEVWNAAQRQLVRDGVMHNYMRMLWGKKILQWTDSADDALRIMVHLNNKYGLDGRDPNSYSGVFWVLGRYDRAWGPKRPIFGSLRYMTSESARKKLRLTEYLSRFGPSVGERGGL